MEPPPSTRKTSTRKTLRTRASVLFADLQGFTALSDAMGPEQAYLVVTGCLRLLDEVARKRGGSVDKYLGDALMAVFGHPVPLEDHAGAAVEAALEMRQRVRDYARELRLPAALELHAGVNTGSFVAGDIHGPGIREFHVLGDAVNVAARLKERAPLGCGEVLRAAARTRSRSPRSWAARRSSPGCARRWPPSPGAAARWSRSSAPTDSGSRGSSPGSLRRTPPPAA